jgi:hypothetical protein
MRRQQYVALTTTDTTSTFQDFYGLVRNLIQSSFSVFCPVIVSLCGLSTVLDFPTYTVKKAQWNSQLENHVTFHLIRIKIVYNVKIIYISTDIKLNSIEFTRFYIVHNVI